MAMQRSGGAAGRLPVAAAVPVAAHLLSAHTRPFVGICVPWNDLYILLLLNTWPQRAPVAPDSMLGTFCLQFPWELCMTVNDSSDACGAEKQLLLLSLCYILSLCYNSVRAFKAEEKNRLSTEIAKSLEPSGGLTRRHPAVAQ